MQSGNCPFEELKCQGVLFYQSWRLEENNDKKSENVSE